MGEFYKVHCTQCGNSVDADKMAFQIDLMIGTYIQKMKNIKSDDEKSKDWYMKADDILSEIRLGLYLPYYKLCAGGLLQEERLKISGMDVLHLMEERYEMTLVRNDKDIEPEADDGETQETEDADQKTGYPEAVKKLADRLIFSAAGINRAAKRERTNELLDLLNSVKQEVLLECRFEVCKRKDDRGEEYISGCKVTYPDGRTVSYLHMVCPHCGRKFHIEAGRGREYVVVMLGSSRVGKTAYLAALVDAIKPGYGKKQVDFLEMQVITDDDYSRFERDVLEVYRRGEKVKKTPEEKHAVPLFPMCFKIGNRLVTFLFVDMPGEAYVPRGEEEETTGEASGSFILNDRRICQSADAFWFCVAPVQIDNNLRADNEQNDREDQIELNFNGVLGNIRNIVQMLGGEKAAIPTAVMVTMSDKIDRNYALYEPQEQPLCVEKEKMWLETDRLEANAEHVMEYLTGGHVRHLDNDIKQLFSFYNYFAVAAYGRQIKEGEQAEAPRPYGILLPFLWTVAALKLLPVKRLEITEKGWWKKEKVAHMVDAELAELKWR